MYKAAWVHLTWRTMHIINHCGWKSVRPVIHLHFWCWTSKCPVIFPVAPKVGIDHLMIELCVIEPLKKNSNKDDLLLMKKIPFGHYCCVVHIIYVFCIIRRQGNERHSIEKKKTGFSKEKTKFKKCPHHSWPHLSCLHSHSLHHRWMEEEHKDQCHTGNAQAGIWIQLKNYDLQWTWAATQKFVYDLLRHNWIKSLGI